MEYEYVSWSRFYALCTRLYQQIFDSGYEPEVIIAIARGGYPGARVLADFFGLMDLISIKIEHYQGPHKMPRAVVRHPRPLPIAGRRVLLVDDVSDSGDTFEAALAHLLPQGEPADMRTAVLHYKRTSRLVPDYSAQRLVKWRWLTYPWAVVEDLTALAGELRPAPTDIHDLRRGLRSAFGPTLPTTVMTQVTPIVWRQLTTSA